MSDKHLRQEILDVFQWDPRIESAQIGVAVENGVVTLTGAMGTAAERNATEEAIRHVSGVRQVLQKIEIPEAPVGILRRHTSDFELVDAVEEDDAALLWHSRRDVDRWRAPYGNETAATPIERDSEDDVIAGCRPRNRLKEAHSGRRWASSRIGKSQAAANARKVAEIPPKDFGPPYLS